MIKNFYLDILREKFNKNYESSHLTRFVIDLAKKSSSSFLLSDCSIELPRINYEKFNAKKYRYVYASGTDRKEFINRLLKIDVASGKTKAWQKKLCYPGEPVFVARPGSTGEDDGIILSVVLDAKNKKSFLLILDAKTFRETGKAYVPHHIPFGFHGNYYK